MAKRRRLRVGELVFTTDKTRIKFVKELHLLCLYVPTRKDMMVVCKGHRTEPINKRLW